MTDQEIYDEFLADEEYDLENSPVDTYSYRCGWNNGLKRAAILIRNEIRPKGKWIPVSERLPDDIKDTYWVCTISGYQCQCRWTNVNPFWTNLETDWHWCHFDVPQYQEVIAWQPLPEPYKKGDAE